jgi:phosphatidylglycerophosphate synthase
MNIPNLISLFRILSIFPITLLVSTASPSALISALVLVVIAYASDGIDGYIARTFHQETTLGSLLDILGDRILEIGLWLIFASQGIIHPIIGIIFIVRGAFTDTIRQINYGKSHSTPFSLSTSAFSRIIVSSRPSRLLYGIIKLATFCFAMYVLILRSSTSPNFEISLSYLQVLAWVTTGYNLLRGFPVIFESFHLFSNKSLV